MGEIDTVSTAVGLELWEIWEEVWGIKIVEACIEDDADGFDAVDDAFKLELAEFILYWELVPEEEKSKYWLIVPSGIYIEPCEFCESDWGL